MIGMRFGRLVVVAVVPGRQRGWSRLRCQCDCGGELILPAGRLRHGSRKNCDACKYAKPSRPLVPLICEECGRRFEREDYRVADGESRHCSIRCYHASKSNASAKKFWANVDKSGECWRWLGTPLLTGGYGRLRVDGKATKAHRRAYELAVGPIPAGLFVLHRCDNPICVRPDHLWLGTAADNNADMMRKGRFWNGRGQRPAALEARA